MPPPSIRMFACFPAVSATVRTNWSIGALGNLLLRLARLSTTSELEVLCIKGYEPRELLHFAREERIPGVQILATDERGITAHVLGSGEHCADTFVSVPLAAALLAPGEVDRLLAAHHHDSRRQCTVLAGVPPEVSPLAYSHALAARVLVASLGQSGRFRVASQWRQRIWDAAQTEPDACGQVPAQGCRHIADLMCGPVEIASAAAAARFAAILRATGRWTETFSSAPAKTTSSESLLGEWHLRIHQESLQEPWSSVIRFSDGATSPRVVLFVSLGVAYSGAEESLRQAILRLPRSRFEPHALLGMDGLFADRLREAGVRVRVVGRSFADPTPETFRYLSRVFAQIQPEIVHFNALSGVPALVVAKLWGCQCVFHLRVAKTSAQLLAILRETDCTIAVSQFAKREIVAAGVPNSRLAVLYDPVDTNEFCPVGAAEQQSARRALGLDVAVPVILMVARYERRKRQDLLIRALAQLADTYAFQCLLVGESDGDLSWEREVGDLIAQHGLRGRVHQRGFGRDIRTIESAADICVLCSDGEPLGTFVLESMAMARAIVVSKHSGLAELIGDDESCGLLCRNGDVDDLARSLRYLFDHPQQRQAMGHQARLRCVEVCGPDAPGLESIYDACERRRVNSVNEDALQSIAGRI